MQNFIEIVLNLIKREQSTVWGENLSPKHGPLTNRFNCAVRGLYKHDLRHPATTSPRKRYSPLTILIWKVIDRNQFGPGWFPSRDLGPYERKTI